MPRPIRRIVTHNDERGRSCALIDGPAPIVAGQTELWTTDAERPDHGSTVDNGAKSKLYPPAKGTLFRIFEIPPQVEHAHLSIDAKRKAWADLFATMGAFYTQPDTRRDPGMHQTASTDYIMLLQGQITLVLDNSELELEPFDVVIQRGTNHAWVNKGTSTALLMAVLIDAGA